MYLDNCEPKMIKLNVSGKLAKLPFKKYKYDSLITAECHV